MTDPLYPFSRSEAAAARKALDAAATVCERAADYWATAILRGDTSGRTKKARVLRNAAAAIRALDIDALLTETRH